MITEIERDICRKSQVFIPHNITDAPIRGFRLNIAIPFGVDKQEWYGYQTVKKFDDMICVVVSIEYGRVTDSRPDILRTHNPRYA